MTYSNLQILHNVTQYYFMKPYYRIGRKSTGLSVRNIKRFTTSSKECMLNDTRVYHNLRNKYRNVRSYWYDRNKLQEKILKSMRNNLLLPFFDHPYKPYYELCWVKKLVVQLYNYLFVHFCGNLQDILLTPVRKLRMCVCN